MGWAKIGRFDEGEIVESIDRRRREDLCVVGGP